MIYLSHYQSPLGGITLAGDGRSVCGLWFDGQRHFGAALPSGCAEQALPVFEDAVRWLDRYFGGEDPGPPPPLAPLGATPFRSAVWALLRELPYGSTTTYGRIAARLGGMSARAVGGAVGRNPISLMIPCHRVLGADGSLTGYAGGTDRKAALLALEGVPCGS